MLEKEAKSPIIVIEDSEAISLLLDEFLKRLGYDEYHPCKTGKEGIDKFKELIGVEKSPIVFLDYNLPDMNAYSVFSQLIKIKPTTKVIIETAMGKNDSSIVQLIASGAYHYIQKPIRFEKLREIINLIEVEGKTIQSIEEGSQGQIESILQSGTQVSLERVAQYTNAAIDKALAVLENLVSEGKAIQIEDIKEIACNSCGSVKVSQSFHCPSCNNSHFKQGKLFEHYDCGNISLADTYQDDVCPKCHKKIKVLGVDYKIMDNYYVCNDCGEKFSELPSDFLCLKCNNKFKLEQAKWKTSPGFKPKNLQTKSTSKSSSKKSESDNSQKEPKSKSFREQLKSKSFRG